MVQLPWLVKLAAGLTMGIGAVLLLIPPWKVLGFSLLVLPTLLYLDYRKRLR